MSATDRCPECGRELPAGAPRGLCPACLLKRGLEGHTAGYTAEDAVARRWTPPGLDELAARFPELEVAQLIGRGGMGAVYQVRQKNLDRVAALKILPPEMGHDPAFAERFAREAQALAKLSHPHIVTIYEFGERAGLYYFVMEYVDDVSLRGLLDSGHVSPKEALAIVPQICDALQYAHERGIVHRDIKPENILLSKQGQVKIADFGLAKLMGRAAPAAGDLADAVMGTPQYMAPEQLERPAEVDHRADIYALGVVFYQMLTGELPTGQFEPPSRKVVIDVRLDEVVLRALEKEPTRRYQQASQIRTQVETIIETPGRVSTVAGTVHPAVFGWEYRSQRTLWGLPLIHVAMGLDPATGRQREARGIVAVGATARGVIAMGGRAYGVIAFGGFAAGLLALGGCAVGLLSFGGCAAALLLAYGGLAVAPVAVGGLALGYYSFGGYALGVHALGPNSSDRLAAEFFARLSPVKVCALFLALFGALTCLYVILVMVGRRWSRPSGAGMSRLGRAAAVGGLVLMVLGVAVGSYWLWFFGAQGLVPWRHAAALAATHPVGGQIHGLADTLAYYDDPNLSPESEASWAKHARYALLHFCEDINARSFGDRGTPAAAWAAELAAGVRSAADALQRDPVRTPGRLYDLRLDRLFQSATAFDICVAAGATPQGAEAPALVGTVLQPDGNPAAKADVIFVPLSLKNNEDRLVPPGATGRPIAKLAEVGYRATRTDADGHFRLDVGWGHLVIWHDLGELVMSVGERNRSVSAQLRPWSRLRGRVSADTFDLRKNRLLLAETVQDNRFMVLSLGTSTVPLCHGEFDLVRVPADGSVWLFFDPPGGRYGFSSGLGPTPLTPGEDRQLTWGGPGQFVRGNILLPQERGQRRAPADVKLNFRMRGSPDYYCDFTADIKPDGSFAGQMPAGVYTVFKGFDPKALCEITVANAPERALDISDALAAAAANAEVAPVATSQTATPTTTTSAPDSTALSVAQPAFDSAAQARRNLELAVRPFLVGGSLTIGAVTGMLLLLWWRKRRAHHA